MQHTVICQVCFRLSDTSSPCLLLGSALRTASLCIHQCQSSPLTILCNWSMIDCCGLPQYIWHLPFFIGGDEKNDWYSGFVGSVKR